MTDFSEKQLVRLEGWSAVNVTGPDAAKFLQGFCTNDIVRLAEGESCEAFFTDVKARVLAFGWVTRFADRCVVLLSSSEAPALATHLDRYLLSANAEVAPLENEAIYLLLSSSLRQGSDLLQLPALAYGAEASVAVGETEAIDNQIARMTSDGWCVMTSADFEQTRIRLGVPCDRKDVDDRNFPQEVDRNETAISFTKGCYLGQEPVARIDAMGQVNWLLRGLRLESGKKIGEGTELQHDGKTVGRVTSFAMTDKGAIGLGYVRREHAASGTHLTAGEEKVEVALFPMA